MLLPHEFAIFDIDEIKQMQKFIETSTATKASPINYAKMKNAGVLDLYQKLSSAIEEYQWRCNMKNLNLSALEDLC